MLCLIKINRKNLDALQVEQENVVLNTSREHILYSRKTVF